MTDPAPAAPPASALRRSVLGLASIIVTGIGLAIVGVMILISLIPEMQAILWLLIVVIPIVMIAAFIGLVLGVIGIVVAVRRSQSPVFSVIGVVLAISVFVAGAGLINGWFI